MKFYSDNRRRCDLSIGNLSRVIDAMEELLVLKNQYNLHVNFEEYFEVRNAIFILDLWQFNADSRYVY